MHATHARARAHTHTTCTHSYMGSIPAEERQPLCDALTASLAQLAQGSIETITKVIPASEVDPIYLGTGFPMDQNIRVVGVAGNLMCPCGGTHVHNSSELGAITVTKIKVKKGEAKVYYKISDSG